MPHDEDARRRLALNPPQLFAWREQLLGPVLLVGALGGLAGAAYLAVLRLLQSVLWPEHHTAMVSLVLLTVLGLLGLLTPYALTFAEEQIDPLLATSTGVGALARVAVAKLVASAVTVTSGWRGGLLLTSGVGVITSQRERSGSVPDAGQPGAGSARHRG